LVVPVLLRDRARPRWLREEPARVQQAHLEGEPRYDELERRLLEAPVITVPAITIASDFDGPAADGAAYAKKFVGKYSHRILKGIGHDVPQEAPEAFAKAVVDVDAL
jgi:pimeloyl-ACP methyl ester carboxylesterase